MTNDLLKYSRNDFSQNGEDGIVEELFRRLEISEGFCCEFGAWDGMHLSNTRRLILAGWGGMQIEGDPGKASLLRDRYGDTPRVTCVNRFVDAGANSISALAREYAVPEAAELDFLSVDIDGLDFEVLEQLDVRPKVICIEVNAGHDPLSTVRVPRHVAANNVGQPLGVFVEIAAAKGYALVCYTGNAFLVRRELIGSMGLRELGPAEAYDEFLRALDPAGRIWLYRVSRALAPPFYRYDNPRLTRERLGLGPGTAAAAMAEGMLFRLLAGVRDRLRRA